MLPIARIPVRVPTSAITDDCAATFESNLKSLKDNTTGYLLMESRVPIWGAEESHCWRLGMTKKRLVDTVRLEPTRVKKAWVDGGAKKVTSAKCSKRT